MLALLVAPLFIAASAVAHPAINRRGDVALSDWSSQNLESYWRFKNRYNSLNCASQSGTDFYTSCCYPLGASESLSDRPAECTPAALTCSASSAASATPTPTPDASTSNTNTDTTDVYDESSLPYCAEGDDGYDDEEDDNTYTNASNNGGSSSSDTYTPPASDNSNPQPTDTGNSGDNNNSGGSTTTPPADNNNNNGGSSGSGSSGGVNTGGFATYYYQNGNAGACGNFHGDYDMIGAIDIAWYGNTGSQSQYCGRSVRITRSDNGRYVDIIVADVCPTCNTDNSFDLSVGAFQAIADLGEGLVPISWSFN